MNNDLHIDLPSSIVKTLLYFDIFDYPLTEKEVHQHLSFSPVTENQLHVELCNLIKQGKVFQLDNFLSLRNDPDLGLRRSKGNQLARAYLDIARKKTRLIALFPFVKGIMISGSLSKGYADHQSDIDFFIVTEPGRLWIARTLLVLYKRLFLFNSHKYFCVNYFIASHHLSIEDQNIFTATEIATLIPLFGHAYYEQLISENAWVRSYLPNFEVRKKQAVSVSSTLKRISEKLINHLWADRLDQWFMHITRKRWEKLYGSQYNEGDFRCAFKTSRYVSTNHPNNYQKKVVDRYENRVNDLSLNPAG